LHMARLIPLPLTVSCFSKIQIGFTFLVPAHPGSPGKGPLNGGVCHPMSRTCRERRRGAWSVARRAALAGSCRGSSKLAERPTASRRTPPAGAVSRPADSAVGRPLTRPRDARPASSCLVTSNHALGHPTTIWNIWPNSVVDACTVKASLGLDKFWQHRLVKFDFTAELTGTGNRSEEVIRRYCLFMIVHNDDADLDVSDTCVRDSLLS